MARMKGDNPLDSAIAEPRKIAVKQAHEGAPDNDETYSEEETARRRDEALRRALTTPPKPHSEMKGKRPSRINSA